MRPRRADRRIGSHGRVDFHVSDASGAGLHVADNDIPVVYAKARPTFCEAEDVADKIAVVRKNDYHHEVVRFGSLMIAS